MTAIHASERPDIPTRVRETVAAALDTKAEEVRVRHLEPVTDFTDYFVFASGTNERQVQAIADAVDERLRARGVRPLHVEGQSRRAVGAARLRRLHRPRLPRRDPPALRPRAPLARRSRRHRRLPAVSAGALAAWLAAAPSLAPLAQALARAAASEAPILLLGEAGTGRTALARALAAASSRAEGPLVELDPGAMPATAVRERAVRPPRRRLHRRRPGAAPDGSTRARGGTLLIDHVEELPLVAQPKLLRLLAERRYAPLGGADVEADVRFLAVGPDDLAARVARGAFREDLFYRLEVLTFRLPPLRDAARRRDGSRRRAARRSRARASAARASRSRSGRGPGCASTPGPATRAS